MAWASNPGYPGVVSDGAGGLVLDGPLNTEVIILRQNGSISIKNLAGVTQATLGINAQVNTLLTNGGVGVFHHAAPVLPTTGGAATAGGTYTATEEAMLNAVYTALRSIGLLT